MPSCSICNIANSMLRNTKKWNNFQREIILSFQRLHLKQQHMERENLELTRLQARQVEIATGMLHSTVPFCTGTSMLWPYKKGTRPSLVPRTILSKVRMLSFCIVHPMNIILLIRFISVKLCYILQVATLLIEYLQFRWFAGLLITLCMSA